MAPFRPARDGKSSRFFIVKAFLLVTGASLGIAGMMTGVSWLIWTAVVVIGMGLALRMWERRTHEEEEE